MKSFWDFRVIVLALVILSLCTYGDALKCYTCPVFSDSCSTITCEANQNACLKLSKADGSLRQCSSISRCESKYIKEDFAGITNFKYECCQSDLCNSSVTSLPSVGLLLSLATALLLVFCR
uniref:MAC-inhibitory protein n=1 Tax=Xenopus laevis TaxID=8355 RepID=A0A3S8RK06_XENLA|nr:CD59 glycoprotein [Xenopus laevis]